MDINLLETMLAEGRDNALLRFTLGSAFIKHEKYAQAVEHLARAVELDPGYSAAWKQYGRALTLAGREQEAVSVYEQGIEAARLKGDMQAVREMQVFLKRLHPDHTN